MKPSLFATLLLLALAACTPGAEGPDTGAQVQSAVSAAAPAPATPDTGALEAHYWHLDSALDGGGQRIEALFVRSDAPVQLQFAQGQLFAQAAISCRHCHRFAQIDDSLPQNQIKPLRRSQPPICHRAYKTYYLRNNR